MKLYYLIVLQFALLLLYGCSTCKRVDFKIDNGKKIIAGIIKSDESGVDGNTFEIETPNGKIYYALVSIPNLGSEENYKSLNINDKVCLMGEAWELEGSNHITVRKIISDNLNSFYAKGIVEKIQHGTDGYTATIRSAVGEVYLITLSIPNLGDKFKSYKIGEMAIVEGELWTMNNELYVKVTRTFDE